MKIFYNLRNTILKKGYHIISLLLLLFGGAKTKAQPFFFRHYQVENGLSNNTVYCSVQDTLGFLWFGTKDGLNRFDGYHFKQFNITGDGRTHEPDLIGCLVLDKHNTLWVGCQKGLYTLDRQKERLVRFIDSFPNINSMQFDTQGQLWFISGTSVCRYNFGGKKITVFSSAKYFYATALCLSQDGRIWACTRNGFLQGFDEATQTFTAYNIFSHSPHASSYYVQKIYPAANNLLLVGTTNQGLKQFNTSTFEYKDLLTYNADKTTVYVRDIKKYADNEFWIATESGIFIYKAATGEYVNLKKKVSDPYSLTDNAVYTLCKDLEGGIWAGTYFGGINYYSKQYAAFQKYFPDNYTNSISGSVVREICDDPQGNLWIGTEDAGLNKLNPVTGAVTQFQPTGESSSIAYTNIHGLLITGNELWAGTFEHGLDVLDIRTGKVIRHYTAGPGKKQLKSNFVVSLLQTKSGEIYVGSGNSLFKYDAPSNGFDPVSETPPGLFISCMLQDHDNTIWAGTHDRGIYYFNTVTKQKGYFINEPGKANSLTANTINAIYEDGKHNLWLATEGGGLCKLSSDRKTFTAYTTANGMPSDFVFKILQDDQQHLWVTTSRGLVNFNPETAASTVFTKDNGLLNDQFNYNSGYKDAQGKMYFGSVKGMISFMPGDLVKTSRAPSVFITGFQVQNKELEIIKDSSILKQSIIYTSKITLPYNRSSFSIDFAALSFISPEMTAYSYKMQGLDNDWTEIKPNRKIYFTNLSPGNYVFKVKAGVDGNMGNQKKLVINILPPFWATSWAYLLYTLAALVLAYYLLRTYHIIVTDKKEKEIYEAKIDFFTNIAHEIRTPLTLIKGPVENLLEQVDAVPQIKEDVVTMERNTNRLIALVTQILDFRQTETKGFSIDFLKVNITETLSEEYLDFAALAKKKKLDYTIEVPPADVFAFADEEALHKIFSNLINNAVKYAQVKVRVRMLPPDMQAGSFTIEVDNDGPLIPPEMREKIFEPFYRLKESFKKQGTGLGLALARSLAELHNGKLYLKEPASGINTFVLCLPLKPVRQANGKFKKIVK